MEVCLLASTLDLESWLRKFPSRRLPKGPARWFRSAGSGAFPRTHGSLPGFRSAP